MAGFISEWWPESNRNGGRHQIGIPGRIASEFAIEEGERAVRHVAGLVEQASRHGVRAALYSSVDALIASLDEKIVQPAEARFVELLKRKADMMGGTCLGAAPQLPLPSLNIAHTATEQRLVTMD